MTKHEEKKYDVIARGHCVTQCDHIPTKNIDGKKLPIYVGSLYCRLQCPHNVSYDTDKQVVECSFVGDMADKAMVQRDDACASCQGYD